MRPSTRWLRVAHINATVTFSGSMSCEIEMGTMVNMNISKALGVEVLACIGKSSVWGVLLGLLGLDSIA